MVRVSTSLVLCCDASISRSITFTRPGLFSARSSRCSFRTSCPTSLRDSPLSKSSMGQVWGTEAQPTPRFALRNDEATRAAFAIRMEPPPTGTDDVSDPLTLAIPGLRDTRMFRACQLERSGDALDKADLVAMLCRLVPHDDEIARVYNTMTCVELRRAIRMRLYAPAAAAPSQCSPPADSPPMRAPLYSEKPPPSSPPPPPPL